MTSPVLDRSRASSRRRAGVFGAAAISALGGFLFGYDLGIISAALLYITPQFQMSEIGQQVVVAAMLAGAIVGALTGSPLTDRIGRKRTLLVLSAVAAVGAVACAAAPGFGALVVARLVLGIAIGATSSCVPAYIAEIAAPHIRGRLVSSFQLMVTVGILASYVAGYALADAAAWRWMLALAAIPAVVMFFGLFRLPESPRWLLARGRVDDARRALARTLPADEIESEIAAISAAAEAERGLTYRDLFGARLRPAVLIGVGVAATNQLVGVNAVISYTPTLLTQAGFGDSSALLSSVGIGAANMICTLIALLLIDRVGRRPLLLGGTAVVVLSLLFLGALYLLPSQSGVVGGLLVAGLILYITAFSVSLGISIWLINSEIFPTRVRGKASGLGSLTHWGLDFIISLTALSLIQLITPTGLFWVYALFGLVGLVFFAKRLPETKGRTLEDIESSLRR
ncbi:sugar porter family MFS transporter [Saccharopolyspora oryzae]|uniref:Sugar porter family MFS transporter n=1 Tax=Saccharopolyspora oryzae TaxID=2997343 RepID=A0ABT4V4X1_9PSEU|nr:sugar porter family MFS transporter [Saccharopolyspora oryzae]MDA3629008.1 sugar porter family MFS transporter [Saccharopolyspora oryzae]